MRENRFPVCFHHYCCMNYTGEEILTSLFSSIIMLHKGTYIFNVYAPPSCSTQQYTQFKGI